MKHIAIHSFIITAALMLSGCLSSRMNHAIDKPAHAPSALHPTTATPEALKPTAHALDVLIILSILVVGFAVAAFFLAPTGHALSFSCAAGGSATLGLSLLLRVSLWIIPWVAIGIGVIGLLSLAYEVYTKLKMKTPAAAVASIESDLASIPNEAAKLADESNALTHTMSTSVAAAVGAMTPVISRM